MNLPQQFEKKLTQSGLILPSEKVAIGCSGGADSVALVYLLQGLSNDYKLKIQLFHFNHGLRGRSADADARFVQKLAEKLGIPFVLGKGRVNKTAKKNRESIEEAARRDRYAFFIREAKKRKIKKIALAHNQDDQAETVLMRLIQGTGPRGLSGIRAALKKEGVLFMRPLLEFSKSDILKYCKQSKIKYREDATNQSTRFLRNRIRHDLLPLLEGKFNRGIRQALSRYPSILNDENQLLEKLESEAIKKSYQSKRANKLRLKHKEFLKLAPALQFRVMDASLKKLDAKSGMDFDAWQTLRNGLKRKSWRQSLPRDIDFELTPTSIVLFKKK